MKDSGISKSLSVIEGAILSGANTGDGSLLNFQFAAGGCGQGVGDAAPYGGDGRAAMAVNDRRYGPVRAGSGGRLRAVPTAGAGETRGVGDAAPYGGGCRFCL